MDFRFKSSHGILLFAVVSLNFMCSCAMHDPCIEKFVTLSPEDKQDMKTHSETCKKKTGLTEFPKLEDLEKNGFDDKCFAKCMLMEKKLVTDKLMVDNKVMEELLKKIPADKQADIKKTWETCAESIKKSMEAEGGVTEKNACKAAAMLKHCVMQGFKKLC